MPSSATHPPPFCQLPDGAIVAGVARPAAVLPGSFNPLHAGHRTLAEVAARRVGGAVHFEMSTANVDKPDLPADEMARRLRQFAGVAAVWVTRAATFVEKAELFPQAAFVVGFDTAVRLIDPKYYGGEAGRDAALERLAGFGCRVIVGGRVTAAGEFRTWGDSRELLPRRFDAMFEVIDESEFRVDVSSTQLRLTASPSAASPSTRRTS
jgi:Cytidylyltransferase-like